MMNKRSLLSLAALASLFALLAAPGTASARTLYQGACGSDVGALHAYLKRDHYLPSTYGSSCFDYRTSQAVMAFQGWLGRPRTGYATDWLQGRIRYSATPKPWTGSRHFRHVEVHKGRQVLLVIGAEGRVQRAIHVSTAAPGHVTPTGHWHVYSKSPMSWSNLFHVWLPWASYVVGGVAMHSFSSVPGYPASHGCIRVPAPEAVWLYQVTPLGTPVWIA
jgi:peptidoglycan hydrolase-like protein with peptidoglycan-binding domain